MNMVEWVMVCSHDVSLCLHKSYECELIQSLSFLLTQITNCYNYFQLFNMFHDVIAASSPKMETFPQNITSLDGKDVTFSCAALGAPLPNVTWIFNGKTETFM